MKHVHRSCLTDPNMLIGMVKSVLRKVRGLECGQKKAKKELEMKRPEGRYRFTEERRIKLRSVFSKPFPHSQSYSQRCETFFEARSELLPLMQSQDKI